MSISSRYKDLLHLPTIADKLTLFQLLFDAQELNPDISLALLNIIHKELGIHQTRDRSVYKRYAEAIESLRFHMADVLQQVVYDWNTHQNTIPEEWFPDTTNNE